MAKKEISILYYIQKDGIRSSMYLNVKQKRFIFGSAEHCGIRIYKNGIFPEHCALTTGKKGNVFIEPLHPSSLTLINNTKLVHRIYLNDNDIITICGERFFFTYLSDNLFNKQIVKISFPISCTEQAQLSKKLKIIHSGKKNHGLFMETEILNEFYVLKKMLDLIGNDIIKNSEYKLLEHHGLINIPNQNIIKRNYFHSNVSLIKYANQCIVKSMDPKTRFTMKFYELFYYLRRMLNSNSNYKCILLQMIQCLSNYCINKDIYSIHLEKNLGMSLKYIYLQHFIEEKIINHKQIQHTESLFKLPITLVSSQPKLENINQNMTVKTNTSYNHNCFSDVNSDKKKQKNHQSNRKISSTYKKRVSLAVKQYHLRKRKSVLKAKCAKLIDVENSAPLVKKKQIKAKAMNGTDENINDASKLSKSRKTKGKRCYKKKNTDTHTMEQISDSQPNEVKQFKEKRRYKKKNNEKEIDKTDSNKCIQEFEKQEVSPFKRITRSMAKSQSSLRY